MVRRREASSDGSTRLMQATNRLCFKREPSRTGPLGCWRRPCVIITIGDGHESPLSRSSEIILMRQSLFALSASVQVASASKKHKQVRTRSKGIVHRHRRRTCQLIGLFRARLMLRVFARMAGDDLHPPMGGTGPTGFRNTWRSWLLDRRMQPCGAASHRPVDAQQQRTQKWQILKEMHDAKDRPVCTRVWGDSGAATCLA